MLAISGFKIGINFFYQVAEKHQIKNTVDIIYK